ncbi:hypothetical protein NPIL_12171 [Nephila pilipes]|uniref:Uncharacterized protein n=1 Tax=Nephila pilipes TaxID=299642 RepID=A0A8X6QEW9_NEPPI|nr:hypothetical protein NPIL_12171 [Nephila pilipes]
MPEGDSHFLASYSSSTDEFFGSHIFDRIALLLKHLQQSLVSPWQQFGKQAKIGIPPDMYSMSRVSIVEDTEKFSTFFATVSLCTSK